MYMTKIISLTFFNNNILLLKHIIIKVKEKLIKVKES